MESEGVTAMWWSAVNGREQASACVQAWSARARLLKPTRHNASKTDNQAAAISCLAVQASPTP